MLDFICCAIIMVNIIIAKLAFDKILYQRFCKAMIIHNFVELQMQLYDFDQLRKKLIEEYIVLHNRPMSEFQKFSLLSYKHIVEQDYDMPIGDFIKKYVPDIKKYDFYSVNILPQIQQNLIAKNIASKITNII